MKKRILSLAISLGLIAALIVPSVSSAESGQAGATLTVSSYVNITIMDYIGDTGVTFTGNPGATAVGDGNAASYDIRVRVESDTNDTATIETKTLFTDFSNEVDAGAADGGSGTTMTRSAYDFAAAGVATSDILYNTTDGSYGTITTVAVGTLTCSGGFSGGTDNTFEASDNYRVGDATITGNPAYWDTDNNRTGATQMTTTYGTVGTYSTPATEEDFDIFHFVDIPGGTAPDSYKNEFVYRGE